jgi:CheY-like chemotaxis protein
MPISGTRTPRAAPLILVVDDDEDNRTIVLEVLSWDGHRTIEATDGQSAFERAAAELPDAIILDLRLPPGPDGLAVFQKLRADPRTKHIPVMFLTAYAYMQQRDAAVDLGAEAFLTKPFATGELRDALARTLAAGRKAATGR